MDLKIGTDIHPNMLIPIPSKKSDLYVLVPEIKILKGQKYTKKTVKNGISRKVSELERYKLAYILFLTCLT